MAMIPKPWRVATYLSALWLMGSCVNQKTPAPAPPSVEIASLSRREGFPTVLVFLPQTRETKQLWDSFQSELIDQFDIVPHIVSPTTTAADMSQAIAEIRPVSIVLVNNPTVRLYQAHLHAQGSGPHTPPVVVLMSSFLDEFYDQIPNATGIAYEVPLITSVVNLRTFLDRDIRKVGVLARPALARYVLKQQKLAAMENVSVIDVELSNEPSDDEIEDALYTLCDKLKIDALWVLNDNHLLKPDNIVSGWLPGLDECVIPVIVGVGALVSPDVHFGSFAMLPDHGALGAQAAELIYELSDEEWVIDDRGVDLPLSIETSVDILQARKHFHFKEEMLSHIDHVIE